MKISVNGQMHDVAARTIALALAELDFGGATIATALNGEFVPATARTARTLAEGDQLEILTPMHGG